MFVCLFVCLFACLLVGCFSLSFVSTFNQMMEMLEFSVEMLYTSTPNSTSVVSMRFLFLFLNFVKFLLFISMDDDNIIVCV